MVRKHGFIQIKYIQLEDRDYYVYQKVMGEDILELSITRYTGNAPTFSNEEIISEIELFCSNDNNTHDSITLNTSEEY